MVLLVANSDVAVAGNFPVGLGDGSSDLVRVEVAAGLGVKETNGLAVGNETGFGSGIVIGIAAVGVEEPVVVGILVVVAGNLLLARALGVGLNVTVEETATIAHILDGNLGTDGHFQWAVPADLSPPQVGLEK